MLKRTALFGRHEGMGARLVEFGGWEMPVQYTGIVEEHHAVRRAAGMFDISHMGEVLVGGKGAAGFLNRLLTNDIGKLSPGKAQYSLMCAENGGVVDDLYVYCVGLEQFLVVVNASRIEEDVAWMRARLEGDPERDGVVFENASDRFSAVAVQGPAVAGFIDGCLPGRMDRVAGGLAKNEVTAGEWGGRQIFVGRTGYTGEDGFEILMPNDLAAEVWDRCLEVGGGHGLKPAGLGARDTLRTEACYPLYGHELDLETTPMEAGLGFFVALEKGPFCGREALAAQKAGGVARRCVAFKMTGKSAPPRPGYPILDGEGRRIGVVASGTQSPTLGVGIGLGYVPPEFAKPGVGLRIEIRGKGAEAAVAQKPFYKRAA